MKKVLFMSLALAVAMTGFAQKNVVVKAPQKTMVKWEQYKALGKEAPVESIQFTPNASPVTAYYGNRYEDRVDYDVMVSQMDLQSNAFVANRMWRYNDGTIGVVNMLPDNGANRGTGYNYYDGEEFGPQPEARIEGIRTGWPSYSQYGANGEIVVAHTGTDLVYYTRATKGEGEWVGPNHIPNPSLGFPNEELTWPRVVTSGPNHDIIHVICATQDTDGDSQSYDFYAKSTDGENWVVSTVPTFGDEHFSADNYALASNGNTVVMLYSGAYAEDAFIIKSTDNGESWTRTTIWDNPYSGMNWDEGGDVEFGDDHTMYCPENGAVCIDNNGMVHCAFSVMEIANYAPEGQEWGCYVYSGWGIDGIFYWNENMGTLQPHDWTCPEDGWVYPADPHDVFRFWYPANQPGTGDSDYVTRNFEQNIIGFMNTNVSDFVNDMLHHETDYRSHWLGCSATPAICVDESGVVAIAFSVVDPERLENMASSAKYPRSVVVSYVEPPYAIGDGLWEEGSTTNLTEEPGNYFLNIEYLQDVEDEEYGFIHSADEAIWVNSITNTVNREFWFAFQADEFVGLNASSGTQASPSDNTLWVVKVVPDSQIIDGVEEESVNPMTAVRVYPNPASDVLNIEVNASQASEMSINVYNIMGQNVMSKTASINTGINRPSISTSELSSGIYFVTVKANGFENTMKFIVK